MQQVLVTGHLGKDATVKKSTGLISCTSQYVTPKPTKKTTVRR